MWRSQADGQVFSPLRQPVFESPSPARRPSPGPAAPPPPAQSPARPSSSYSVPPGAGGHSVGGAARAALSRLRLVLRTWCSGARLHAGRSGVLPPPAAAADPAERHRQQQRRARRVSGASAGAAHSDEPARSRSVSFRVPDDDSSDSDAGGGDDGATSGLRGPLRPAAVASSSGRRHPPDPVHTVHLARTRELKRQVQASCDATTAQLQAELQQIESDLRQELQRVAAQVEGKQVRSRARAPSSAAAPSLALPWAAARGCAR